MLTGTSWKTTSAGISLIVAGIVGFYFAYKNNSLNEAGITASVTSVLGGIGLIFAKDAGITGGTTPAANNDPEAVKSTQS